MHDRTCVFGSSGRKKVGKIDAIFLPNLGFVGRIAMRPYILLLHDLSFLIEPRWFSLKSRLWHKAISAKRCIQNAAHLLAVSETTKRDAMRLLNIPEERITVIPIGFSLPSPATHYSLDRGGRDKPAPTPNKYILALGGNDPRKNTGTAVRAVEDLRREKDFSDLELILVGAGLSRLPCLMVRGSITSNAPPTPNSPLSIQTPPPSSILHGTRDTGCRCTRRRHSGLLASPLRRAHCRKPHRLARSLQILLNRTIGLKP